MDSKTQNVELNNEGPRAPTKKACDFCRKRKIKCSGEAVCSKCARFNNGQCSYTTPILKRGPKPNKDRPMLALQAHSPQMKVSLDTDLTSPHAMPSACQQEYSTAYQPASSSYGWLENPTLAVYWPIVNDTVCRYKLQNFLENFTYQKLSPQNIHSIFKYFSHFDSDAPLLQLNLFLHCLTQPFTQSLYAILDYMGILALSIDHSLAATRMAMHESCMVYLESFSTYFSEDPLIFPRLIMERAISSLSPSLV